MYKVTYVLHVLICTLLNTVHSTIISFLNVVYVLTEVYLFQHPAIMCPALLDPINGAVTWTSLTEGGVATYVCDDGFELEGSMTRTCESSGMWSGVEPMCRGMLITSFNECIK